MENNNKSLAEFIKDEHLDEFRTYDFEYKMKESFGSDNVWCIDSDRRDRQKVIVIFNNKITTLEYIHSMFNGSSQHHYTLITEL